jgi:hypothetical protein
MQIITTKGGRWIDRAWITIPIKQQREEHGRTMDRSGMDHDPNQTTKGGTKEEDG